MCSRIALGLRARRVAADEHGDDLAVVVDEVREQRAHRVGRASATAATMPSRASAIQSPSLDRSALGATESRTAWVTSPVRDPFDRGSHRRVVARRSARRVVVDQRGERFAHAGGRHDRRPAWSVRSSTWRATGTMFLLFGSTTTDVRVARLDRFEDLRRRRVHRLATRDDLLHAEAREQAAHAVADTDRDDRGLDGRRSRPPRPRPRRAPTVLLRPAR